MRLILICAFLVFQGCASPANKVHLDLEEDVFYKHVGKVCDQSESSGWSSRNEKCFNAVGVLPLRDKYKIKFYAANADLVKIRGCGRTRQLTKEGDSFKLKDFKLSMVERDKLSCGYLRVRAFDYDKQMHSYYFIAFRRKTHKLPFTTVCDGYTNKEIGIGACQVGMGQIGLIKFDTKVKLFRDDVCPFKFKWGVAKDFEFRPKKGGQFACSWTEAQEPYRKGVVYFEIFDQEIFPMEHKK